MRKVNHGVFEELLAHLRVTQRQLGMTSIDGFAMREQCAIIHCEAQFATVVQREG